MDRTRQMPDREKFQHAFETVRLYQKHVLPFVEERLGAAARNELSSVWQAAIARRRESWSDGWNYELAYSNWLWMARCSHDFLADQLDRDQVAEYKRLLMHIYERQQDSSDLSLYRMFKSHSALMEAWAYEMQWLTPIESISKTKTELTCVVNNCKILQIPATERVCRVDCRNVGANLARKIYHLDRKTIPVDHGCTITLTPLEDLDD